MGTSNPEEVPDPKSSKSLTVWERPPKTAMVRVPFWPSIAAQWRARCPGPSPATAGENQRRWLSDSTCTVGAA